MTTEVLGPHAAGNHRALVSKETDDRGMLTRLAAPRAVAPIRGQASRQEHRQENWLREMPPPPASSSAALHATGTQLCR